MDVFMIKSKRSYIGKDKYGVSVKSTKLDGDYIFMTEGRAIEVGEDAKRFNLISEYEIVKGTLNIDN